MAHALVYPARDLRVPHGEGIVAQLRRRLTDYWRYRETLAELRQLNDDELEDLGMSRFALQKQVSANQLTFACCA